MRFLATPSSVQLFLTNKCNLVCEHCFAEDFRYSNDDRELTGQEWVGLLRELRRIGVFRISLSGGEPFSRDDILSILGVVEELRFPHVSLNSNGTRIGAVEAQAIARSRIQKVMISLDGTQQTHDAIRGVEGAFARTMTGIQELMNNGVFPLIEFTLMKKNCAELDGVVALAEQLGLKEIYINRLSVQGRCSRECYVSMRLAAEQVKTATDRISHLNSRSSLTIKYSPSVFEGLMHAPQVQGTPMPLKTCHAAHQDCAITPTGWVIPCSSLAYFRAGNVRKESFPAIWKNSEVLQSIRRLSEITMDQVPFCAACRHNSQCGGGCRGNAFNMYGDLFAPDPDCPFSKDFGGNASPSTPQGGFPLRLI